MTMLSNYFFDRDRFNRSSSTPLRAAIFAMATGSLYSFQAYADESLPASSNVQSTTLPPIEVMATPLTTPLTVVTDPKTPRQPLPASDGADYLKTIPGFAAIRNGGTNSDLVLRGMFGSRLNILSNGIAPLGACPARMDAPTSYIAPESYDKVTVIKGPESVLYGPGASAGTVLFERNTPRFDAPGIRFDSSLVGGSYGRNDQNIDFTAGMPEGYARITANHAQSQDYKDGNGNTVPSAWDKWNADATVGITPDANTKIELTAGTGNGDALYAGRSMDGTQFRRDTFALSFDKRRISEVLDRIQAQIYYNEADHVMDNYTLRPLPPDEMAMASEVRRRAAGGRVAATWLFADTFKLVTGFDMQTNKLDSRGAMDAMNYSAMPWDPQAKMSNLGAFGELTWYASHTQRVITGARLDYANARDERSMVSSSMMDMPMPNPTFGDTRQAFLPSGFVRYEQDLSGAPATWYVGLGHTERFPDYWELFSPQQGPAGSVNAFSAIQPEKTTQLDIGAQYTSSHFNTWISAYAGIVQDFILFDYSPDTSTMMGPSSSAMNVNARIMGGEIGSSWQPTARWRFGATLAYAWGNDVSTGQPLPQIPPLEVRLSTDYTYRAWGVGALWRVVAPQRRVAVNEGNVVGQDFGPSAGFGVLSLHAQYDVNRSVQLALGIDNLFNKAYSEHLNLAGNAGFGYPANTPVMEPGRILWARLRFKL